MIHRLKVITPISGGFKVANYEVECDNINDAVMQLASINRTSFFMCPDKLSPITFDTTIQYRSKVNPKNSVYSDLFSCTLEGIEELIKQKSADSRFIGYKQVFSRKIASMSGKMGDFLSSHAIAVSSVSKWCKGIFFSPAHFFYTGTNEDVTHSKMKTYLTNLIVEKGARTDDLVELEVEGHFGFTWDNLIEYIDQSPEYHEQIKSKLVLIYFLNGDVFHFLNYLANGMVKNCFPA